MSVNNYALHRVEKKLIFIGEFLQGADFVRASVRHFSSFSSLSVEFLSNFEFEKIYSDNLTLESSLNSLPDDLLLVLVFAENLPAKAINLFGQRVFVISCVQQKNVDLVIAERFALEQLISSVNTAFECLLNRRMIALMSRDMDLIAHERRDLCDIGIALSAEKDLDKLLSMVLAEGRKLANCEAASLYLLTESESGPAELLFKLTQNSEINFDFKEKKFPLTNQSLAGYVALTGEILNVADAYQLKDDLPFKFDKNFDHATGYRTRQLLVMPMRNHRGKIIGVLQFINHRDKVDSKSKYLGFSKEKQALLMSLASQAAVAIDNSQLIENIQSLFEGFVAASVQAIESRDPVTSGHSFRVAEFTTGLAEALDHSKNGLYKSLCFSKQQIREIRYASLLHDFGKVGVKENVLLKADKLMPDRLLFLQLKIDWQKQLLQKRFFENLVTKKNAKDWPLWQNSSAYRKLQVELEQLKKFQILLLQANKPSIMEASVAAELEQLFHFKMDESFLFEESLLNQDDFMALSVTRGSLTESERLEIQSHVVHTESFLRQIPWTEEFSSVPIIAASHHEKLDGSGYPRGSRDKEIPVASKIMAIADIYDALTATDRPYKKAVKSELALDILNQEADNGKLCRSMVNTFIEAKIYQKCQDR